MQSAAERVIEILGGLTGTARALGRPVSTVQGWKERRHIPPSYWRALISAASARGHQLSLDDFVEDAPAPEGVERPARADGGPAIDPSRRGIAAPQDEGARNVAGGQ